jgi:hypothetical protein
MHEPCLTIGRVDGVVSAPPADTGLVQTVPDGLFEGVESQIRSQ